MSFHATLSPKAIAKLQAQKRNSTISSIISTILAISLMGLILGLIFLPSMRQYEETTIFAYSYQEDQQDKPPQKTPKQTIQKKPSPPTSTATKIITTAAVADVAIPVPELDISIPSPEFDESMNFGSGWNTDSDVETGIESISNTKHEDFQSIPSSMRKRCSPQERMQRLKQMGGTAACEKAVIKALDWLKRTQNEDGSWSGDGKQRYPVAMTAMAILAYLGHCETPNSTQYGETVSRGITYLVNIGLQESPNNLITTPGENGQSTAYEHGIATYALSESYTFCKEIGYKIPYLEEVTKKAGERILDGQTDSGGYFYQLPNEGQSGTNAIGFWQLLALKAFKHTEILSENKFARDIDKAIKRLESIQGRNGAIGYRDNPSQSPELTGGALLCMQLWNYGDSESAKNAADYMRKNTRFEDFDDDTANLYYHYYNAQAMIHLGGEDWKWYNDLVRDKILSAQQSDGSWEQKMHHGPINTHMATCLSTLVLETYYRYLPGTQTK